MNRNYIFHTLLRPCFGGKVGKQNSCNIQVMHYAYLGLFRKNPEQHSIFFFIKTDTGNLLFMKDQVEPETILNE